MMNFTDEHVEEGNVRRRSFGLAVAGDSSWRRADTQHARSVGHSGGMCTI